jgi:hypothetical protein
MINISGRSGGNWLSPEKIVSGEFDGDYYAIKHIYVRKAML